MGLSLVAPSMILMRAGAVQVGVSMVLSFMIVVDLPTISKGVASLSTSRLAPFYREVAPSVTVFANLFGKALQAQVSVSISEGRDDQEIQALL